MKAQADANACLPAEVDFDLNDLESVMDDIRAMYVCQAHAWQRPAKHENTPVCGPVQHAQLSAHMPAISNWLCHAVWVRAAVQQRPVCRAVQKHMAHGTCRQASNAPADMAYARDTVYMDIVDNRGPATPSIPSAYQHVFDEIEQLLFCK